MSLIKLIVKFNTLHTPASALSESWHEDNKSFPNLHKIEDRLLFYRNGYGEPVLCDVSQDGSFDKADLAIALFDARETGQIEDVREVLTPDGETFVIDADYGQDAKLGPVTW